jgi:WD40 repeat protein
LITESEESYLIWPTSPTPAAAGLIKFGPPRKLADARKTKRLKEMRTAVGPGSILAIPALDDGALLVLPGAADSKESPRTIQLGPQKDVRYCAISPDGRFVATGAHDAPNQPAAVIWDAKTGARIRDIPALPRTCEVGFSPDSRWLITSGGGCKLWDTSNWQPGPVLGGSTFAFSPDGKMLAVEGVNGQVKLVDPATGSEFARLTAPNELHSLPACFNHDGSLLTVYGSQSQSMHVWDLRAVRDELRKKNLDWDLPPLPPPLGGPTRVEMVGAVGKEASSP